MTETVDDYYNELVYSTEERFMANPALHQLSNTQENLLKTILLITQLNFTGDREINPDWYLMLTPARPCRQALATDDAFVWNIGWNMANNIILATMQDGNENIFSQYCSWPSSYFPSLWSYWYVKGSNASFSKQEQLGEWINSKTSHSSHWSKTEHWTPQKIAWDPLLRIRLPQDPLTYSLYTPNSNEDTQVVIYILETSVHNVSTTISLNDNQCQLYSYIIFYSIMLFGICSIQV